MYHLASCPSTAAQTAQLWSSGIKASISSQCADAHIRDVAPGGWVGGGVGIGNAAPRLEQDTLMVSTYTTAHYLGGLLS